MKKIICSILAASLMTIANSAFAGYFYIGPQFFLENIFTGVSNFRGGYGQLEFGYGGMMDDWFLAGEIFAIPATWSITNHSVPGTSVRTTYGYGVSLSPGFAINNSVVGYLRLSALGMRFNQLGTTRPGVQGGVGLQACVDPCWDLRLEYDYTVYRSVSSVGVIKSDSFGLGVIYKFSL